MNRTDGHEDVSQLERIKTIQFKRSRWKAGCLLLFAAGPLLMVCIHGLMSRPYGRDLELLLLLAGVGYFLGAMIFMVVTERATVRRIDGHGVALNSGRRFGWNEFRRIRPGEAGFIYLEFTGARGTLYLPDADDSIEVARVIGLLEARQQRGSSGDTSPTNLRDPIEIKLAGSLGSILGIMPWVALLGILGAISLSQHEGLGVAGVVGSISLFLTLLGALRESGSNARRLDASGVTLRFGRHLPWSDFQRIKPSKSKSELVLQFARGEGTLHLTTVKISNELLRLVQKLDRDGRVAAMLAEAPHTPPQAPPQARAESVDPALSPRTSLVAAVLLTLDIFVVAQVGSGPTLLTLMFCCLLFGIAAAGIGNRVRFVHFVIAAALYAEASISRVLSLLVGTGGMALALALATTIISSKRIPSISTAWVRRAHPGMTALRNMFGWAVAGSALGFGTVILVQGTLGELLPSAYLRILSTFRFQAGLSGGHSQVILLGLLVIAVGLGVAARWRKRVSVGILKWLPKWLPYAGAGLSGVAALALVADGSLARLESDAARWSRDEFVQALHAADQGRRRMVGAVMVEDALKNLAPEEKTDLRAFLAIASESGDPEALIEPLGLWLADAAPSLPARKERDTGDSLARARAWLAKNYSFWDNNYSDAPSPHDLVVCSTEASRLQALSQMAELSAEEMLLAGFDESRNSVSGGVARDFIQTLVKLLAAKYMSREPWNVNDLDSARSFARASGEPARRWEWQLRPAGAPQNTDSGVAMNDVIIRISQGHRNERSQ